jgi:hypothetical protein
LLLPAALITLALLVSLAVPASSPVYLPVAAMLGIVSIGWSVAQLPAYQRRRVRPAAE